MADVYRRHWAIIPNALLKAFVSGPLCGHEFQSQGELIIDQIFKLLDRMSDGHW